MRTVPDKQMAWIAENILDYPRKQCQPTDGKEENIYSGFKLNRGRLSDEIEIWFHCRWCREQRKWGDELNPCIQYIFPGFSLEELIKGLENHPHSFAITIIKGESAIRFNNKEIVLGRWPLYNICELIYEDSK